MNIDSLKIAKERSRALASARRLAVKWDSAQSVSPLPSVLTAELKTKRNALLTEMENLATPSVDELEELFELPDTRDADK